MAFQIRPVFEWSLVSIFGLLERYSVLEEVFKIFFQSILWHSLLGSCKIQTQTRKLFMRHLNQPQFDQVIVFLSWQEFPQHDTQRQFV